MKSSLLILLFILFTLTLSFSPWLIELAATPKTHVFSGIFWWSPDYFTYLSYVELGRRGELGVRLLRTTQKQEAVYAHLPHTLTGLIMGKMLGLDSVTAYHFGRALYGFIFLLLVFIIFYKLSKSKSIAWVAFIFAFYIGGLVNIVQLYPLKLSRYLTYLGGADIIARPIGPLHYTAGYICVLITIVWFLNSNSRTAVKILILAILLNLTLLANPFAFIIAAFSFSVYTLIRLIFALSVIAREQRDRGDLLTRLPPFDYAQGKLPRNDNSQIGVIVAGFLLVLPLVLYFRQFLSKEPWGLISTAPGFYRVFHPPIIFSEVMTGLAPLIICAVAGLLLIIRKKIETKLSGKSIVYFTAWILTHFILLFWGDNFKIDPIRANQGLFYIPLSLFAAYFIVYISRKAAAYLSLKITTVSAIVIILTFILALPNYILTYRDHLFAFTDFKNFSLLVYPSKSQVEALNWMEKNTKIASGVFSMYEASQLLEGYSASSTSELGVDEASKIKFYSNLMTAGQARIFLKEKNFEYVYMGYQEAIYGGQFAKSPFLQKVFENEEVKIYKVI